MQQLTMDQIDEVAGGSVMGTISAAFWGASAVSGGLACIPTPASGALAAFTVITGVLAAGAAYIDSNYSQQ